MIAVIPDVAAEQMPRDDEGDHYYDGSDGELPQPEVALKEKRHGGEHGGDDTTDGLRAEMKDDAGHKTAHATHQTEQREEALAIHAGQSHRKATQATGEADEDPHEQNDVLVERATVGALIVLVYEVDHQRCAYQGNASPKPMAPVFIEPHQSSEFQ